MGAVCLRRHMHTHTHTRGGWELLWALYRPPTHPLQCCSPAHLYSGHRDCHVLPVGVHIAHPFSVFRRLITESRLCSRGAGDSATLCSGHLHVLSGIAEEELCLLPVYQLPRLVSPRVVVQHCYSRGVKCLALVRGGPSHSCPLSL